MLFGGSAIAQPFCCVHGNKNCAQDVLISKLQVVGAYRGYDVLSFSLKPEADEAH